MRESRYGSQNPGANSWPSGRDCFCNGGLRCGRLVAHVVCDRRRLCDLLGAVSSCCLVALKNIGQCRRWCRHDAPTTFAWQLTPWRHEYSQTCS